LDDDDDECSKQDELELGETELDSDENSQDIVVA